MSPSLASQRQTLVINHFVFISPGDYFESLYNRCIAPFLDNSSLDFIY